MSLANVLPLALFILMAELVIGSFLVMLLTDFEGEVGGPFLGRSALWFLAGALLAGWIRGHYPQVETLLALNARLDWLAREGWAFTAFVLLLALYNPAVWIGRRRGRWIVGGLAGTAGIATLVCGALAYGQAPWSGFGTVLNFLAASLALGGAMTGLMLGHSYLSTPLLSPRPLRHITIILFVALLVQTVSLPFYLGWVGFPDAAEKGSALMSVYGLILGVRVAIGLVFPLVLAALAWHTARIKAMRSATGLLYIGIGVVLTGEIVAKVLFFVAALPV